MGLSSLSYLRSLYPSAKIIYGVPKWVAPFYENCQTDADEILPLDFSSLFSWWKLWWILKKASIDHIYEMHLSGRSKKFFDLFASFNSIPYQFHNHHLGIHSEAETDVRDQGKIKPLIQRDLDGVWSAFDSNSKAPRYQDFSPKLKITEKIQTKKQVILGVVATRSTKMWPLKYYVDLANMILEKGLYQIIIPLSKSQQDSEIERELKNLGLAPNCLIVKVPLKELAHTMAGSSYYIGNDTGLKHIAISLGIKTFTFFGPEPPLEWHPYDPELHPYFYKEPLECRTKDAHYCGLNQCDSMICLNDFLPTKIYNVIFKENE